MSLKLRALIAVSLMVGFYVFSIAIICILVAIPYAEVVYLNRFDLRIIVACLAGAFAILVSIIPRRDKFSAPGPRILPEQQPRLFSELNDIARATGQAMPREVYLIPDVNAWVSQRGGFMGVGSRRVMGLGVPLMALLNVSQFRSVIAHEFGHYYGRDTALGPWIYQTRSAIGRTLAQLEERGSGLIFLFRGYANLFLRVTLAISRAQEYAADRIGAKLAGAGAMIGGLKQIHKAAPFWSPYVGSEVAPILDRSFSPPVSEGFLQYLGTATVEKAAGDNLETELREGKSEKLDSHPSLRERIAALAHIQAAKEEDMRPATVLLEKPESVDCNLFLPVEGSTFAPVRWDEVNQKVWIPAWKETVEFQSEALTGLTVRQLVYQLASGELARRMRNPAGMLLDDAQRISWAAGVAVHAMAFVLATDGWTVHALPGEYYFEKLGVQIYPAELGRIAGQEMKPEEWLEKVKDTGIADLPVIQAMVARA
ncbi:MAG: M48 family metallopeptidase [Acidobacteriaceae bacterium]